MLLSTGYGRGMPEQIPPLLEKRKVSKLLDIRYWRKGKTRPEWSEANLRTLLGDAYLPLTYWGNRGKYQGEVELVDFERGWEQVQSLGSGIFLLMCACGLRDNCHRRYIAEELETYHKVTVKEIKWPAIERDPGEWWDKGSWKWRRDELMKAEAYLTKTPDGLYADKCRRVVEDYRYAEERIRLELDESGMLLAEGLEKWAKERLIPLSAVEGMLRRMERSGVIETDYAGPSMGNNWWHWWTYKEIGRAQTRGRDVTGDETRARSMGWADDDADEGADLAALSV